jgi:predicted ATPase
MLLKTLTYQDKSTGWTLQNLELDRFNLLVGASGVGKTRILRAIRHIRALADGADVSSPASFVVTFEHVQQEYTWEFESTHRLNEEAVETPPSAAKRRLRVVREKLSSVAEGILFDRNEDKFSFRGTELPRLNRAEPALILLNEPVANEVRMGFSRFILGDVHAESGDFVRKDFLDSFPGKLKTLEELRALTSLSAVAKAFCLQKLFPEQFDLLKTTFLEIFPSAEDLDVQLYERSTTSPNSAYQLLQFVLKERGVPGGIRGDDFSSGMLRTLIHLVDLWLAPVGTVVLIDEFENSLGVNCMGPLTEFIQSRASELQFIITSHHPYIISKIPKSHWKVVRRKGSVVRVTPTSEIRALQGTSAQDDFTRLLNSPEFEEGLA